MKSKWIRAIASLMTCAVLSAQIPAVTLNAQQTDMTETDSNEAKSSAAENNEARTTETDRSEAGMTETDSDEAESSEAESSEADSEETDSSEAGQEATERDESQPTTSETGEESETKADTETSEVDAMETESETEPESTEADSSKIRYILGREMTPEEIARQEAMEPDYMPELEVEELPDSNLQIATYDLRAAELPETYDARGNGAIPAVRDQDPWGTCWAFSFLGAMENSLVRQHDASVDEIDLSEQHLVYFTYHTGYDALGNASDDTTTSSPEKYYLKIGGNNVRAAAKLMNWQGAALESEYPYSNSYDLPAELEQRMAQDVDYTLKGCYFIPTSGLETAQRVATVKELIMDYDCVSWSYYHDSALFYNPSTAAYFNNEIQTTNHAILVVGWDDTYEKENFQSEKRPENDGAWIVRNSWGSEWGDDGYFYVSYEDVSMGCANAACVVTADKAGIYDNNYFHGNVANAKSYGKYAKVAQIYQAKSPNAYQEKLSAVSFMIGSAAIDYSIQVYKNPERVDGVIEDPESGTPMLTEPLEGVTTYAGVYTVELPEPVLFHSGEEMAIVISFPENKTNMYCDVSSDTTSGANSCSSVNATEPGESMYMLSTIWEDSSENNRSFRINALTTDVVTTLALTASYDKASGVKLQWDSNTDATRADIYRSTTAGEQGELIAVEDVEKGSYADKSALECGKSYFYSAVLWTKNTSGKKVSVATTDSCEVRTIPAVPEFSDTSYQEPVIHLKWTEAAGAEGYFVERSDNAQAYHQIAQLESADSLTYTDSDVSKANTYEYRVIAYNTGSDGTIQCSDSSQPLEVNVYPDPVEIAGITENQERMLEIVLPVDEHAQGYTLYRSENSEKDEDFVRIADRITDSTYTDCDVQPDTTYYYKVLVTINGVTSQLADSKAESFTTKPVLTGLSLSVTEKDMLVGSSQELMMSAEPAHYPYQEEIVWSAFDEEGHSLVISDDGTSLIVSGNDEKEILRITNNQITATGASEDKTVRLEIAIGEIRAACTVSIYQNGFWVSSVKDQTYTGKALTPKIRVYDKSRLLTEGTDYSVTYKNNINVNTASDSAKAPAIVVTGKGNYSGTQVVTFRILPDDIAGEAFGADDIVCAYDSKKVQHPVPELYRNGVKLKYNRDYTAEYPDTAQGAYKATGTYPILIKGKGNYSGTREITLTITDEGLISKAAVSKVKDQTYTGNPIEPKLTVKLGKMVLVEDEDYTVTYENNINCGTATAIITGNGTTCHGTKRVSFKIIGTSIKKASVTGLEKSLVYTGEAVEQTGYRLSIKTASGTKTLSKETDYQVSYANNTNVGTATIIFTGINGYTGTLKKTYKITPYDIGKDSDSQISIDLPGQVPYAKGGSRPEPVITFGGTVLTYGTDYKLSYQNNKSAAGSKVPQITVTGIRNFKGTRTLSFHITTQDIGLLTMKASDKVYSKKAGAYKTKLSVVDLDGKVLTAGKDYARTFRYTYASPTTLADGRIRGEGETVGDKDIIPSGTVLNVTITGMNNYTGTLTGQYRITEYDISKAKVTVESQTYTGKEIKPDENDIRVTFQGKELAYGTDYVIEDYADNVKKGNAKVILRGIGRFGGTKTAKFRIKSKTVVWWK